MDDARLVRGLQAGDDLFRDGNGPWNGQPSFALQNSREVVALDVRHRDVLDAVDLAEIVDAHDVLVRHLARQQQLALEAPLEIARGLRVRRDLRPDDLQGDRDAELVVPCLIDGAHSARAEQTDEVVPGSERGPRLKRARRGLVPWRSAGRSVTGSGARARLSAAASRRLGRRTVTCTVAITSREARDRAAGHRPQRGHGVARENGDTSGDRPSAPGANGTAGRDFRAAERAGHMETLEWKGNYMPAVGGRPSKTA
jgi:hypothetical protein